MDYDEPLYVAMGCDLEPGDVILEDGEFYRIRTEAVDEGDIVGYGAENLSGGDDDYLTLDPLASYDVYETA